MSIKDFFYGKKETVIQDKKNRSSIDEPIQPTKVVTPACFTEEQAAIYINMSRGFLRAARMNGPIKDRASAPDYIRNGRTIRYLKSDLDTWLESLRVIQPLIDE